MNILALAAEGAQPVPPEVAENLLGPFIEATRVAFAEIAGTEVAPQGQFQRSSAALLGDMAAFLNLSGTPGTMGLGFPKDTARALAERVLANVADIVDENLIGDCLGEMANVIGGQAKALLAATPYHFSFSTPTIVPDVGQGLPKFGSQVLAVIFHCELGDFALQLFYEGDRLG